MAHILVTGGCGFIGSHVAEALLARGDHVTILDNLSSGLRSNAPAGATLIEGDINDAPLVRELAAAHSGIVHLAAIASVQQCRDHWLTSHRTNVGGTISVLDAAAHASHKPPVIYASSAAVYGDNPRIPLAESEMPAPLSSYGLDKLANEHYAAHAWSAYGVASVGLRFFNVYGPRQDPASPYSGVISIFANAARQNKPITFLGDGEQTRDFIYVGDVAQLVLASIANARESAQVLNGCTGKATSLLQLADTLRTLTGAALPSHHAAPRAGDIRHSLGNPERTRAHVDFVAKTPLHDGLATLIASF
jgi:UDP-glucose 4-epimerase